MKRVPAVVVTSTPSSYYIWRRSSQGKTCSGQECKTDRSALEPTTMASVELHFVGALPSVKGSKCRLLTSLPGSHNNCRRLAGLYFLCPGVWNVTASTPFRSCHPRILAPFSPSALYLVVYTTVNSSAKRWGPC